MERFAQNDQSSFFPILDVMRIERPVQPISLPIPAYLIGTCWGQVVEDASLYRPYVFPPIRELPTLDRFGDSTML